jgi:hypothetical protein
MINGIHQYSTESLIKELEKRGWYSYELAPFLKDIDEIKKELEDDDYRKRVGLLSNPYSNE